jgi:hypothetical protein
MVKTSLKRLALRPVVGVFALPHRRAVPGLACAAVLVFHGG